MRIVGSQLLCQLFRHHLAVVPAIALAAIFISTPVPMAGANNLALDRDFDDLHTFQVVDGIRTDESTGFGAVQLLNVIWLGDSQAAVSREGPNYGISQPAEALRMRDWQNSGMD